MMHDTIYLRAQELVAMRLLRHLVDAAFRSHVDLVCRRNPVFIDALALRKGVPGSQPFTAFLRRRAVFDTASPIARHGPVQEVSHVSLYVRRQLKESRSMEGPGGIPESEMMRRFLFGASPQTSKTWSLNRQG
jgi:hypothetical protein